MTDREFAIDVVRRLRQSGYEAVWAGGCVRDELLGLEPADYDVATSARPEEVQRTFPHTVAVGESFGVVEVLGPRRPDRSLPKVQVATFRSDGAYVDGRRPESVVYSTAAEDAQRRDFTINGMFFDPLDGRVIDYVGGQADLRAGVLRAIGDPRARFREDKLRLMRAVRMAARFDFPIEPATAAAVREMAPEITVVSAERIAEELRKMLAHRNRAWAMRQMDGLGLLRHVLPEVEAEMKGLPQGPPSAPTGDLWQHTLTVLEVLDGPRWPAPAPVSFPLAFAALLHDVGKKRSAAREADKYTFHGHEHIGKRLAANACRRLKLSNAECDRVSWLVERHQYLCDAPTMRASKLKPILVHPGIGELLTLHRADSVASGRSTEHVDFCERMLRETPPAELNPPPVLTGDDLKDLGWKPGPHFKPVLDAIRDAQLEGKVRSREEAIRLAEEKRNGQD